MSNLVIPSRTVFRYVTHTIRVFGVNTVPEDEEKCSQNLTELFAEGWQRHDHQVTVKRSKVVHTWILTRIEPEKAIVVEPPKAPESEAPAPTDETDESTNDLIRWDETDVEHAKDIIRGELGIRLNRGMLDSFFRRQADDAPSVIYHVDSAPTDEAPTESAFARAIREGKTLAEVLEIGDKEAYDNSMKVVRKTLIFSPVRKGA